MPQTKIVLIGAGSASFAVDTMAGLLAEGDRLRGTTLSLVDVDARALEVMTSIARRANDEYGAGLNIESTTDRRAALVDAEFVVVSVEVDRFPAWKRDWALIGEHGSSQFAENGGPGGLAHGLRIIPIVVDICRDVALVAPRALVLNYTNPMSRVCLAATRHTSARVIGLCHQIGNAYYEIGRTMGWITAPEGSAGERSEAAAVAGRLGLRACGLNHLTFLTQIWDRESESDLYPLFRERLASTSTPFAPLARRVHDIFGLYPTGGDKHSGEYFGWSAELADVGPMFAFWDDRDVKRKQRIAAALAGDLPLPELLARESEFELDRAVDVIMAMLTGTDQLELAINVVNDGAIPELPPWAVVEVPAVIGADGVRPLQMPSLPRGVTALLNQQIVVQDRAVEAAVHGDRTAALQALLLDPVSGGRLAANEQLLDGLIEANRQLLPQFAA